MKLFNLIAGTLFVAVALVSVGDAIFWRNWDSAVVNMGKTVIALILAIFLVRGSTVSFWFISVWSAIGALAMAFLSATLKAGPSITLLLVSSLLAYLTVLVLVVLARMRSRASAELGAAGQPATRLESK